jgi:hypothetical protein
LHQEKKYSILNLAILILPRTTKEISQENFKLESSKKEREEKCDNSEKLFEETMKEKLAECEKLKKDHESLCLKVKFLNVSI